MRCKIVITDEVNVKIEGLPVDVRRKIANKFKFAVPYARYLPQYKLGRWDGKVGFFGLGGNGYVNHLDKIIEYLHESGVEIEEVNDKREKFNLTFDKVDKNYFSAKTWPKGHLCEGQAIELRDYQVDVINNFIKEPQSLQEVATGAGKTIITAALSSLCEKFGRTLVIVPNKGLVTQTEEDYINVGLDVGVYFGDRKELNRTHTICTWQSLNVLDKKAKAGESIFTLTDFLDGVKTVIIDEVHQAKAEVLKKLLTQHLKNAPVRWGLTGTIPKEQFEFQSILASIGPVVNQISAKELQDKGVLSKCHVNVVQLIDTEVYKNYQEELKYLVTNDKRLTYLGKLINKIKEGGNTLVLIDRLTAGKRLAEIIDDSVFIQGETKLSDRKEQYDEISDSDNKVIIATYGVASVGINIPRIFNLILIEPGKSFVRVIQSIGRGIRKAKDKDFVQIWDLTSSCKFAKRHLTHRKKFYKEANYPFTIEKVDWTK
jgi:superfamily II DNA or RNA helicase|tara:strand:+ start:1113 stop:2570 length:1458 start_codon:yes stop_codon:yes gene_type:complete